MENFKIFVDKEYLGTTKFEFSDVLNGIVYGQISLPDIEETFDFLVNFSNRGKIKYKTIPEEKAYESEITKNIEVFDENGIPLFGEGASVRGHAQDFQIDFYGISKEEMKTRFPQHYLTMYGKE